MTRWEPDSQGRLAQAALALYSERGFEQTTVAEIAKRAGLTERTFFRHFADKREVLFAAEGELPALVARLVSEAPLALTPLALIERGLQTVAVTRFEGNLDYLRTRRAVIQADEGLRERELRKTSVLADAIRQALVDRGTDELAATLTAQLTVTVLGVSVDRWLDQDGEPPLTKLIQDTLGALRLVTGYDDHRTPSLAR